MLLVVQIRKNISNGSGGEGIKAIINPRRHIRSCQNPKRHLMQCNAIQKSPIINPYRLPQVLFLLAFLLPFLLFLSTSPSSSKPAEAEGTKANPSNPFTSIEDPEDHRQQYQTLIPSHPQSHYQAEEDDDVVHPMLHSQHHQPPPSKSPARRHSPMVHYPSWSEVSEFDFTGESSSSLSREQQQHRHSRRRSGGGNGDGNGDRDGYGRDRESVVGRWELA